MKKFFVCLCLLPLLFSCGKSNEEKAIDLLTTSQKGKIDPRFKFEYSDFKIDTLYQSLLFVDGVKDSLDVYLWAKHKSDSLDDAREAVLAEDSVWMSEEARQIQEARFAEIGSKLIAVNDRMARIEEFLGAKYKTVDVSKQFGWIVSFKSEATVDGVPMGKIPNVFVTDKEIDRILWDMYFPEYIFNNLLETAGSLFQDLKKDWDKYEKAMTDFREIGV